MEIQLLIKEIQRLQKQVDKLLDQQARRKIQEDLRVKQEEKEKQLQLLKTEKLKQEYSAFTKETVYASPLLRPCCFRVPLNSILSMCIHSNLRLNLVLVQQFGTRHEFWHGVHRPNWGFPIEGVQASDIADISEWIKRARQELWIV